MAWKRSRPFFDPRLQVEADRAHVADDLALRLLEGEVEAALAAAAGGVGEVAGEAGLAGARRARDEDAAAAVEPRAAEHGVEPGDAGGDPLARTPRAASPSDVIGRTEMPSSSIRNGYSLVPCARPAVLDDAQPPGRDLLVDPVVEQDDAVGDVLLQAVPGQRAVARARR